jgi:hypothetical protein
VERLSQFGKSLNKIHQKKMLPVYERAGAGNKKAWHKAQTFLFINSNMFFAGLYF